MADIYIPHYMAITQILSVALIQRRTQEEGKKNAVLDMAQEY